MDPVPDLIHILNCGSAGNRTHDFTVSSQACWPLDQRGGHPDIIVSLTLEVTLFICELMLWTRITGWFFTLLLYNYRLSFFNYSCLSTSIQVSKTCRLSYPVISIVISLVTNMQLMLSATFSLVLFVCSSFTFHIITSESLCITEFSFTVVLLAIKLCML